MKDRSARGRIVTGLYTGKTFWPQLLLKSVYSIAALWVRWYHWLLRSPDRHGILYEVSLWPLLASVPEFSHIASELAVGR